MKYVARCALFALVCWGSVFCAAEREEKDGGHSAQKQKAQQQHRRITYDTSAALRCASKRGDVDGVRALLSSGANVRAADKFGRTALHRAANRDVAQLLLDAQANIEADGGCGSIRRPLLWAIDQGNSEVATCLLERKASVAGADREGWLPLHAAAGTQNVVLAERLLEAQADVAAAGPAGATALHLACEKGSFEVVLLLLKHKAPVDVRSSRNSEIRNAGDRVTPLLLAARNCPSRSGNIQKRKQYTAIMRELVALGASTETRGRTMYDWLPHKRKIQFYYYDVKSMMYDHVPISSDDNTCLLQ